MLLKINGKTHDANGTPLNVDSRFGVVDNGCMIYFPNFVGYYNKDPYQGYVPHPLTISKLTLKKWLRKGLLVPNGCSGDGSLSYYRFNCV